MIKYATLALTFACASAFADSTLATTTTVPVLADNAKSGFHGQVGFAVAHLPEYIGSDQYERRGLPLINVSYNDTLYFKFNRLGTWMYKSDDNSLRIGAVITTQPGYDKDDGELLVLDRDDSIMAGLNAVYRHGKFSVEAGLLTDVSDNADGNKYYATANYQLLADQQFTVNVIGKVEYLDQDIVGYYYDNYESATNLTLGLVGTYQINDKWSVLGLVSATKLADEISESVIGEDDQQNVALVGVTYSF